MTALPASLDALPARFTPLRLLGRGGMAEVWLADDAVTQSQVALKVLLPHLRDDPVLVERFMREAAVARRIVHPHVIQIYDLAREGDLLALVMEYHPGEDVKHTLRARGALPWASAVRVIDAVLAGLSAAHDQGVMHRDMKPHNVLWCPDAAGEAQWRVKIADFGLARVEGVASGAGELSQAVGTIEYMAPEQLDAYLIDHRADLYAVSVMLYELITGQLPFQAPTPMMLAQLHAEAPRPDVRALVPDVPEHVALAIMRGMQASAEDRFATAHAMRAALASPERARRHTAPSAERDCPACGAPLIPRLITCVECGYTPERLVRAPGRGAHAVAITRRMLKRRELTQDQLRRLTELLDGLEGADEGVALTWELADPAYTLSDHLTREDAARLRDALNQREIPAVVLHPGLRGLLQRLYHFRLDAGQHLGFLFMGFFASCPMMVITVQATEGQDHMFGVVLSVIVASVYLFFWALNARKKSQPLVPLRADASASDEPARALERGVLPERLTGLLTELSSSQLKGMVRRILAHSAELIARARELGEDERAPVERSVRGVLERTAEHVERVVAIERALGAEDIRQISARMAEIDAALRGDLETHEAERLINARAACLDAVERIDALQHELTWRTGQLLHVSGELGELLAAEREAEGIVLSIDSVSVVLDDLHLKLDAAFELEHELHHQETA